MVNETTTTILTDANAPSVQGDWNMAFGTYTARTAGGNTVVTAFIDTGMNQCYNFTHATRTAAENLTAVDVSATFPTVGTAVAVTVLANTTGHWIAWGR